ncbi:JNK1/MAPK8-associated membrane protein-like [Planoprotostelium fungivorum]|uniref:JNK1/MAPK8-associated membrane protein-like n=1 Tax=Planoprotostelium fungivorum TaxID=1890364 RepID=A0A2P6N7S0_9EUKA|nr:JNK1/MAPK8-associated membrane protein-like [Planoprotostelium fungivorum]
MLRPPFFYSSALWQELGCYNSASCKSQFQNSNSLCIGRYCGRHMDEDSGFVISPVCTMCPRGSKTDHYVCVPCTEPITNYGICYLVFIIIFSFALQTEVTVMYQVKHFELFLCIVSIAIELALSMIFAVLTVEPLGSLKIYSCVQGRGSLSDWYTLAFSPHNNYCANEAVYPLWTMVMVFYGFCAFTPLVVRSSILLIFRVDGIDKPWRTLYFPLYLYPALTVLQAIFGGLIYYSFPYLSIISMFTLQIVAISSLGRKAYKWPHLLEMVSSFIVMFFGILSLLFFFNSPWSLLSVAFIIPFFTFSFFFCISICCS